MITRNPLVCSFNWAFYFLYWLCIIISLWNSFEFSFAYYLISVWFLRYLLFRLCNLWFWGSRFCYYLFLACLGDIYYTCFVLFIYVFWCLTCCLGKLKFGNRNAENIVSIFNCSYGSFFGPSQPVIAQRVIQESKSLLENQHLASWFSNPQHIVSLQNFCFGVSL